MKIAISWDTDGLYTIKSQVIAPVLVLESPSVQTFKPFFFGVDYPLL
jgi:hypothetical protein